MRNLLISMVANFLFWWTKQIFFLVIKLEPLLLSWLQPRKSNCVPTELDVSISAIVLLSRFHLFFLDRLQGHRTRFETFQTNKFSWINHESKVNNFWDPEIGRFDIKHSIFISSTSLGLHGIGKKIYNNFYMRWMWPPHDNATPLLFRLKKAKY